MCLRRRVILRLVALLAGCAAPTFKLSDESAIEKLMGTRHVAELQRENPTPLTCWVEDSEPDARQLYLGEDHQDHTVRAGTYRVTADGRVWLNADPALPEDAWTVIE